MEDNTVVALGEITKRMETLIKLLALPVVVSGQPMKDKAVALSKCGLQPKEIADLLDTTPNTISVALSAAKRVKKKASKK